MNAVLQYVLYVGILVVIQANSESSDSIIKYYHREGVVFYDALLLFQQYSRRHTHDYEIPHL